MSENGPWTVKEDVDFINYLVEISVNEKPPLDSAQLCDKFKQRSGSSRTVESLVKRIDVIFWKPHFTYFRKLMDFDEYKSLKLLFTSSAPVSFFLLIERKIEDNLGKDNPNQRRVQFSQVPLNLSVSEINEKLTEFLTGISQNPNSLTNSVVFVKQFDAEIIFRQQYYVSKNQIYVPLAYDKAKTVKKLFVSQVRIDNSVLKELRKDAVVEVDEKNRIINYKSHDGSLILKQKDDVVKRNRENEQLMKFIAEKCKETEAPLSIKQLSREFIEQIGLSVKESRIENRIRSLLPKIPKLEDFYTETKVRMLFSLNASIDQNYLNELQKNAIVEVDEKRRIIKYATNDGSSKLQRDHMRSEKRYSNDNFHQDKIETSRKASLGYQRTKNENETLINFIAEKSRQANSPLCISQLVRDFIENIGSSRSIKAINSQLFYLRMKIPKLVNFDTQTKVRMLFSLSVPIDQEYLNELQKNATVEIDDNQRITTYKAKNGSLKLKRRHWSGLKKNKLRSTEKRKIMKTKFSEDVIYDGPGEPIPAELPVKREPNVYDELFWKKRKNEVFAHDFSREPIPKQLPLRQHPIEFQKRIWQEEEYKPEKIDLLVKADPDQSEVKLEPIEYEEQNTNWQEEEEYKPNPSELFYMELYSNGQPIDQIKFEDSKIRDNHE